MRRWCDVLRRFPCEVVGTSHTVTDGRLQAFGSINFLKVFGLLFGRSLNRYFDNCRLCRGLIILCDDFVLISVKFSFPLSYWLRRPLLYVGVYDLLVTCRLLQLNGFTLTVDHLTGHGCRRLLRDLLVILVINLVLHRPQLYQLTVQS